MTLLKVCGLTRRIDVEFIDKYADYAGFIIYSDVRTPRLINPNEARELASILSKAKPVAVVRGLRFRDAVDLAARLGFPILQYHGVVNLNEYINEQGSIKIAPVIEYTDDSAVLKAIGGYLTMSGVEYVLIDAPKVGHGVFEHGLKIPLSIISRVAGLSKVGVAGGIGPSNVKLITRYNPYLIDVNSGVESSPGVKDHELVMEVVKVVKGEGST